MTCSNAHLRLQARLAIETDRLQGDNRNEADHKVNHLFRLLLACSWISILRSPKRHQSDVDQSQYLRSLWHYCLFRQRLYSVDTVGDFRFLKLFRSVRCNCDSPRSTSRRFLRRNSHLLHLNNFTAVACFLTILGSVEYPCDRWVQDRL